MRTIPLYRIIQRKRNKREDRCTHYGQRDNNETISASPDNRLQKAYDMRHIHAMHSTLPNFVKPAAVSAVEMLDFHWLPHPA